jgi:hypothetical protein
MRGQQAGATAVGGAFFAFLVYVVVGVLLVAPIVALVCAHNAARSARENEESWQKLSKRVYDLEAQLRDLKRLTARTQILEQELGKLRAALAAREGARPAEPVPLEPPKPAEEAAGSPAAPTEPAPVAAVVTPLAPAIAAPVAPAMPLRAEVPAPPAMPTRPWAPLIPPPRFETLEHLEASPREVAKSVLSLEEVLGANWLNKLGVVILVIGVALFLAYQMRELGPPGRVLIGFVTGGALLGAGILYEHRERYRLLARAGIGGGWALAFFTTYAMYHVEPARVLHSQAVDLALLLAVAAVMVAHTLRYRSQVVTGLAFLLAFVTVTISRVNVYSLSAGAILAVALVVIVGFRGWFELEVFGILASYLNHYYWLRPIVEPMGRHRHTFPEFYASAALLVFYWLVFRASYLLRRPASPARENVSTVAALLNTFLLLGVMKYQSVHPEWAFRFLLLLGALEFTLGQLPLARRRRAAFVILTTVGSALLVAALPFKYSGTTLPVLWLAEAEALILAGVFTGETVFRRLGLLASFLVAFQMDRLALRQIYDTQWKGFQAGELGRGIIVFTMAVLIFYADAHWLRRRHGPLAESRLEALSLRVLSYAAAATAFIGIWWLAPEAWAAVGFAGLALALAVLASRTEIPELLYQAHTVAALAFLRVLFVNLGAEGIHQHVGIRLVTVGLTAAFLYAGARWSGLTRSPAQLRISAGYTWAGSFLVALLSWYELTPVGVAVAWTLVGLALFEVGRVRSLFHLRLQAYFAFAASFLRVFYVNFNASGVPGELSPRFYTTLPLALAFYYIYGVMETSRARTSDPDRRWKAPQILCFFGTFAVAGLARFELEPDWVVAAWAALAVALLAIAWRYSKRVFLHQALLLGAAALLRGVLHNFYERSYFPAPFWLSRSLTVGVAVALLLTGLPFAFQLKRARADDAAERGSLPARLVAALDRDPSQVFFFIPFFLLTILLALEMRKGMVTVAWGVEAVAVFLFALWVGQRSYRLAGLALLLLCVGKIVALDVWGLQPRDRYLTFIVLGIALLGVSFLYTRYREAIRQYL